jgi:aspartyl/glutamyl-tRNA(Asn/Gln) amidotransferase C subunit
MVLDQKELKRLQKLACISLSPEEQVKLGNQLQGIISFLDTLQEIKISCEQKQTDTSENPLRTWKGVRKFDDTKALLQNVKHEKINNSIVIKSVLS